MRMYRKNIGFIAGCFDGFHLGHQYILREARKRCSELHVAINYDKYIIKYKGSLLTPLKERRAKLLDYGVNHVHSFYRNPIYLIKKIRPKVIFVGDDYEIEDIVGYEECKLWGGKVQIIKRIPGFSSTKIRLNNT